MTSEHKPYRVKMPQGHTVEVPREMIHNSFLDRHDQLQADISKVLDSALDPYVGDGEAISFEDRARTLKRLGQLREMINDLSIIEAVALVRMFGASERQAARLSRFSPSKINRELARRAEDDTK